MTVLKSNISWTTGTLNIWVGCSPISAACDLCYANTLVHRLLGGGFFETVREYPERLKDLRKFYPARGPDGLFSPKLVFVNSLSDFWFEKIDDKMIHRCLDAFEQYPNTVMQILTKRPGRMRRIIKDRYGGRGVPAHFWLGVTAEDNRVKRMLDIMRATLDEVGDFTSFASVEPIVAPTDELDFTGIKWVILGGESGPGARPMKIEWVRAARDHARDAGAAIWMKQWGTWANNPLYQRARGPLHRDKVRQAIRAGEREAHITPDGKIIGEKGGATLDGEVLHEFPPHYHRLKADLNLIE